MKLPEDGSGLTNICGTPCYIAPEVFPESGYKEKCDIFSLGSVLFNMLVGRYLFKGDTV